MQRGPVEIDVATPDRLTLPFHDQVFGLRITLQPVPVLQRELVAQERRAHRFRPRHRVQFRRARAGVEFAQERQRSEEHTSELQSLMRTSYAVFCLQKKKKM